MKKITRTKLPKWIISRIPFMEEEETASAAIVPGFIFSCFGIIAVWREFYDEIGFILGLVVFLSLMAIIVRVIIWLMIQVDILKILRNETTLRYKLTEDPVKKQKLKEILAVELCVKAQNL